MKGSTASLTRLETRLFLREPMWLIFGLLFPPLLLLAMGFLFPGFDEPLPELDGERLIVVYAPTVIGLAMAMLSLMALPMTIASYREEGILRRMRTTPVHPARLLVAQVTTLAMVAVVGTAATLVVGALAFDVPFPKSPIWFVVAFAMGLAAMLSMGLLVGAVSRSPATAQVIGFALFFPMLFFAGVYVPRGFMSDGLTTISNFTPLGAAVQAMMDAWVGTTPAWEQLLVMALYTVVFSLAAVRLFRWE